MAKLFSIELCYLATIAFHLYQLQTTPTKSAGPASFAHLSQLQVSQFHADLRVCISAYEGMQPNS